MTLLLGQGILAQLMSDGRFPFVILKLKQGLKALSRGLNFFARHFRWFYKLKTRFLLFHWCGH